MCVQTGKIHFKPRISQLFRVCICSAFGLIFVTCFGGKASRLIVAGHRASLESNSEWAISAAITRSVIYPTTGGTWAERVVVTGISSINWINDLITGEQKAGNYATQKSPARESFNLRSVASLIRKWVERKQNLRLARAVCRLITARAWRLLGGN